VTRVRKVLRELVADLQERRLWPVAVGLLVALVAIPTVLSTPVAESGQSVPAPDDSGVVSGKRAGSILTETQPIVSLNQGFAKGFRRAVRRLPRKDPFVQQAKPKKKPSEEEGGPSSEGAAGGGAGSTADAGTITAPPGTSGGGLTGTGTDQPSDVVLFEYTAAVSFGEVGDTKNSTLHRLDALPSATEPVVVFMGVLTDGETAVFLVSDTAVARGDGECKPDSTNCQFVHMKKNDVELIDVPGTDGNPTTTTYELELRAIKVEKVGSGGSSSAKRVVTGSRARSSSARSKRAQRAAQARREKRLFGVFDLIGF
jgi:hypothetical protein